MNRDGAGNVGNEEETDSAPPTLVSITEELRLFIENKLASILDKQAHENQHQSDQIKDLLQKNDRLSKENDELSKRIDELLKKPGKSLAESNEQTVEKKLLINQIESFDDKNDDTEAVGYKGIVTYPVTFPLNYASTFPCGLGGCWINIYCASLIRDDFCI